VVTMKVKGGCGMTPCSQLITQASEKPGLIFMQS